MRHSDGVAALLPSRLPTITKNRPQWSGERVKYCGVGDFWEAGYCYAGRVREMCSSNDKSGTCAPRYARYRDSFLPLKGFVEAVCGTATALPC